MLTISGGAKLFLYGSPVDMRKGFEGLGYLIEQTFEAEITSGSYFIFLNRAKDRMKVLYWDVDGLAIWYKRLEKGTFSSKERTNAQITRRDFLLLLEGVTPKRINRRYNVA